MTLLRDIEPMFHGARIFGCTPHRITDKDLLITKWGSFYSVFVALIFLYACVAGLYLTSNDVMDMKMLLLTTVRTVLMYICIFTDAVLTIIWNERLRGILVNLHAFDVSTKFSEKINTALLNRCRLALGVIFVFWSLVGYVSYRCEKSSPLFNAITYAIVYAALSMQLLKFFGFLTLLYQRFAHLEKLIVPEGVEILVMSKKNCPSIDIHDIWWLHNRLITSAEEINSVYTTQLLFWITTMFLNALSRIYTLTGENSDFSFFKVRETLSVAACLVNLLIITAMCHFTALQGNKVGSTLFSPSSVLSRKRGYVQDNVEVGMYFHLKKLHFSAGAGFIRIDLPLLLSIGGAMTTYLVILHALNSG